MKSITQSEVRRLFVYNKKTGVLCWKVKPARNIRIGSIAGTLRNDGRIQIRINGKGYKAHRLIWLGVMGYFPEHGIDHEDRNPSNNSWDNLREVSRQCNQRNRGISVNNSSGIKGVYFDSSANKWRVRISTGVGNNHCGNFDSFTEAVCHRFAAEQCLNWHMCESNSSAGKYIRENIQCDWL